MWLSGRFLIYKALYTFCSIIGLRFNTAFQVMDQKQQYPLASPVELKKLLVGKRLNELPTPIAVIDRYILAANCKKMRDACRDLNVLFRPHVKTHKVIRL